MNRTHTESAIVRATECDQYRRMRLDALFVAMQEVGERHAVSLGVGYDAMMERGLFFALARIHVRVARAPRCGEEILHITWPGETNRFFCPRYHVFTRTDGAPLATAGALWVLLDVQQRRVVSPLKLDLPLPDTRDLPAPIELPIRVPSLGESPRTFTRTPVYSDFDINRHVNNTKYISWLCDALGNDLLSSRMIGELTVGYEKEICREDPLSLSLSRNEDAFSFEVLSSSGEKHFVAGGTLKQEEE